MIAGALSVASGAAVGALCRWVISDSFNGRWAVMPAGTLICNLVGAFVIGVTLAAMAEFPQLSPNVRLFLVTGLLGALTTFSTFSNENVQMLMSGDVFRAFCHASVHLFGSLALTYLGYCSWRLFQ